MKKIIALFLVLIMVLSLCACGNDSEKSNDDGNSDLLEWMCDTYMSKSGTISYPNRQGGEMKHLSFKEGYMVEYAETYDNKDEMQQYEEFTITCKEIQVGNARHNNRWTIDNN